MIPDGQGEAYPEKSTVSALCVSEGNFPAPKQCADLNAI
nr:MAG TPA: hypothetical protein [Caudoviricetes sp.]